MIAVPALVIRRTYPVTPQTLYAAWTTPEIASTFLGPDDVRCEIKEMDVRVGGRYGITMRTSDEDLFVSGVYREVASGRKLVMTWRWQEDDAADEYDTLLTLEFNPHDGGTELILTHEQIATERSRKNHEHGWTAIVEQLGRVIASDER